MHDPSPEPANIQLLYIEAVVAQYGPALVPKYALLFPYRKCVLSRGAQIVAEGVR